MTGSPSKTALLTVVTVALLSFMGLRGFGLAAQITSANAQSIERNVNTDESGEIDSAGSLNAERSQPLESAEVQSSFKYTGEYERQILENLAERRRSLDQWGTDLDAREEIVKAAERRLEVALKRLEKEKRELELLRDEQRVAHDADIEALISAYERMKSKEAAAIFDDLDQEILISVASGMRTQALAGVLGEMKPSKARALTIYLAERNQTGRKSDTEIEQ